MLYPNAANTLECWCLRQVQRFCHNPPKRVKSAHLKDMLKQVTVFYDFNEFECLVLLGQLELDRPWQIKQAWTAALPEQVRTWLADEELRQYLHLLLLALAVKIYLEPTAAIYEEKLKGSLNLVEHLPNFAVMWRAWTEQHQDSLLFHKRGSDFCKINAKYEEARRLPFTATANRFDDMDLKALWILRSPE